MNEKGEARGMLTQVKVGEYGQCHPRKVEKVAASSGFEGNKRKVVNYIDEIQKTYYNSTLR